MKSLSRALTLLTELSQRDDPMTLSDLSESVGLHKSTVHRMLATFLAHGLVSRDEANRYVVGPRAYDLAAAAHVRTSVDATVRVALATLGGEVGEMAWYAVADGRVMRCIAAGAGPATPQSGTEPRGQLHATALGKAYLAYRPHDEVLAYASRAPLAATTPFTITDGRKLQRVLRTVRQRGYATEDRECDLQSRRVGVSVLDRRGYAVAAIGVGVPALAEPAEIARIAPAALRCAADIEQSLFGARYPRTVPVGAGAARSGKCLPT